jgi:hypothetical protein
MTLGLKRWVGHQDWQHSASLATTRSRLVTRSERRLAWKLQDPNLSRSSAGVVRLSHLQTPLFGPATAVDVALRLIRINAELMAQTSCVASSQPGVNGALTLTPTSSLRLVWLPASTRRRLRIWLGPCTVFDIEV